MIDHVLDGGHGRDVSLKSARRAQQIHHVRRNVHLRKCHIAFGIGVRMSRDVTFISPPWILNDVRRAYSIHSAGHLGLEYGAEGRTLRFAREHYILALIRPSLGSVSGL